MQELFDKMKLSDQMSKEREKARELFSWKPFCITYRPVYLAAKYGRYGFGLVSIITGFEALAAPLADSLPYSIACTLSGLMLFALEWLKSFSGLQTAKNIVTGNVPLIGAITLLTFGASVHLSLDGSRRMHQQLDQTVSQVQLSAAAASDSVRAAYLAQIESEKTALKSYLESVSWQGKVDASNRATRQTIERHNQQIAALQSEMAATLQAMAADQETSVSQAESQSAYNGRFWLIVSGVNELLIVFCLWFMTYYQHRLHTDTELLSQPEKVQLSFHDFQNLQFLFSQSESSQFVPLNEAKGKIGFPLSESLSKQETLRKNQENDSFSDLLNDVKNGCRDYRTLCRKHGVNVLTVKSAIQQIETQKVQNS